MSETWRIGRLQSLAGSVSHYLKNVEDHLDVLELRGYLLQDEGMSQGQHVQNRNVKGGLGRGL
eukprot:5092275-Amphidinium_carterae.1